MNTVTKEPESAVATIGRRRVRANGLEFECLEAGAGPLVLCLHGFPDTPLGFSSLLEALAAAGYRAVAPYARGYFPSGAPSDDDYGATAQARDVIGLIDAFGAEKAIVIGHDWGAIAAYAAANLAPGRIERLLALSVPPLRIAKPNASWLLMVMLFQITPLAAWLLRRRRGALVDRIYRLASPKWAMAACDTTPAKECVNVPGGARRLLGYYRAAVRSMLGGRSHPERVLQLRKIAMPAMLIAGSHDPVFSADMLQHFSKACSGPSRTAVIKGTGHFPHREMPAVVNAAILAFLDESIPV